MLANISSKRKKSKQQQKFRLFRVMAPFKLFKLGQGGSSSRSISQETEPDSTPHQSNILITTTTNTTKLTNLAPAYLESDQISENSSLMSLNDQRALLSSSGSNQIGTDELLYLFPSLCLFSPFSLSLSSAYCFLHNHNFPLVSLHYHHHCFAHETEQ